MTLSSAARLAGAAATCLAMLVAPGGPVAAQTFPGHLSVRVYDFAALDDSLRTIALDEARRIMADAGSSTDWHDCRHPQANCAPEAGELVVRIVREVGERRTEWHRALGYAVVDTSSGSGTLATIYVNRVESSARHAGADLPLLLGRAIAHEVGHLILRTNAHGDQGLMRAIWTEHELARNLPSDWVFAASDGRQLRAALQRINRAAAR